MGGLDWALPALTAEGSRAVILIKQRGRRMQSKLNSNDLQNKQSTITNQQLAINYYQSKSQPPPK